MIGRRGFIGSLIAAAFSPANPAKPAATSLEAGAVFWGPKTTIADPGAFAWKPVLRRVNPGLMAAPAGFVVQPMYKHIASLPITVRLNVDGSDYPSSKAPYVPKPGDDEPMDWMDNEMISWRNEHGALTGPPEGHRQ